MILRKAYHPQGGCDIVSNSIFHRGYILSPNLYVHNEKRCKEVTTMGYSVQEASLILRVPYSTVRRWLVRHNISTTNSITNKPRITEEGLEELRSISAVKNQIKEIVALRFAQK
jgi:transposase